MVKPIIFFAIAWLVTLHASVLPAQDGRYLQYQQVLPADNDSVKCRKLINYAIHLTDSLHNYNLALQVFEKANALLKENDNDALKLSLYYNWGFAFYEKSNYREADRLFSKALEFKLLDKQPEFKAKILNNAGANLYNLRALKRAMSYYNQALEIYIQHQNHKGMASVYWNMANIISSTPGNFKEADLLLNKSINIFLKYNLLEDYGAVLATKANMRLKAGHADSAIALLKRVLMLPFKQQMKKPLAYLRMYISLAKAYSEMDSLDKCFYYLSIEKRLSDSMGFSSQLDGSYYFTMGYCYDLKGDYKKAVYYYKNALVSRGGVVNYRFLYENIADIYLENKQYDSAFYYKNVAIKFADSLYASELKEHITFENKRIELLEKNYQSQISYATQQRELQQLEKKNYLLISVILALTIIVLLLFLYFRQYRLRIKKEHLQSELDFLRAQLNPHFLFNSINNIYVLIDENKDKAATILLKFSELMRYQLYDCNVSAIHLDKELQFLENYIEFEKLRYSNKIVVSYSVDKSAGNDLMIAPLLLQPFIENAFKHTPKNKDQQSYIEINAVLTGYDLVVTVSNTLSTETLSELPGGIGLKNVKKRLKLLYSNKHDLKIIKTDQLYSVTLKLTLAYG